MYYKNRLLNLYITDKPFNARTKRQNKFESHKQRVKGSKILIESQRRQ